NLRRTALRKNFDNRH
ncbi:unnamed protein product, partial [Acanthoscelides obtectus]